MDNNITTSSLDSLYTLKEAMDYLKISRSTFYKLMSNGDIKGIKIGRVWRFRKEDIESFITRKANDQ